MRTLLIGISALLAVMALAGRPSLSQVPAASRIAASRPFVTRAEFDRWRTELSNWAAGGKRIRRERSI